LYYYNSISFNPSQAREEADGEVQEGEPEKKKKKKDKKEKKEE
jgi:hypothetical protein